MDASASGVAEQFDQAQELLSDAGRALAPLARRDRLACVLGAEGGLLLRLEDPVSD